MKTTPYLFRTSIVHKSFVFSVLMVGFLCSLACFTGCSKSTTDINGPTGGNTITETTTVYGRVVDESGKPVAGATVSAGTSTATSDANGLFVIRNTAVPKGRAIVLAKKTGFFTAASAASPGAAGTTRVQLSMMADNAQYSVSASSGGKVSINGSNGASITFQANSFQTSSGDAYSGTVSIAAKYLNPASSTFNNFFSGDNTAQASDGTEVSLTSCGVLRVELKGSSGEVLKLDPSKPATIVYPKTADAKAPSTMPLWYFDETLGMWKEDGSATLSGNSYTGTVTHFTDWNLDYKGESGSLELRVVCGSVPVAGVAVKVFQRIGYTDMDGKIRFLRVPADQNVQLEINASDNGGIYYINKPMPLAMTQGATTDIGDVSLNSPCPASISGQLVDCGDSKVEGLVTINDGTNLYYVYTKTGDFSAAAASGVILTVTAMDANGNVSVPVTVPALGSGEDRDMGKITVCGTSTSSYVDITPSGGSGSNTYYMLALSADGSRLAASTYDQKNPVINIYDTKTGQVTSTATLSQQVYVNGMEMSTDNTKLLARTYNGAMVFDISGATATLMSTVSCSGAHLYDDGSKFVGASFSSSQQKVTFMVYSSADGSVVKTLSAPLPIGAGQDSSGTCAFSHEEEAIVYPSASQAQTYSVWGVNSDAELRSFSDVAAQPWYFSYSEDGATVGLSGDGAAYNCYDTKTGTKISSIMPYEGATNRTSQLVLTKNNAYAAVMTSKDLQMIQITKLSDGSHTIKLMPNSNYVSSITASRSENYLAVSSAGLIRVWKLQ